MVEVRNYCIPDCYDGCPHDKKGIDKVKLSRKNMAFEIDTIIRIGQRIHMRPDSIIKYIQEHISYLLK